LIRFLLKRVLMGALSLFVVTLITFFLMNLIPGGPFLSEKAPSQAVLDNMNAKYGLDKPLSQQYITWLTDLLHGDFGISFKMQKNRPVLTIIKEMFPVSVRVGSIAMLWAIVVGVTLGCLAAYNRGKAVDSVLRVFTTLGVTLPAFVTATVLMVLFAGGVFRWLPSNVGMSKQWYAYILPCFTLGFNPMCSIARYTRSSMLDSLSQDYIRTANAKGLTTAKVIFKHALRNALIPLIAYIGPMVAFILTGGFVVETVFSIPGLGRYFVQSVTNRDYPIIMGTTVILSAFVIVMVLIMDILYHLVDPRITLGQGSQP